jgi:cation diffusion facilitator CzcD-associated flavoprotein CzcO
VNSATWNEEKAKWLVSTTVNGEDKTEEADFFIVATGHFSEPRLPDYPGRDEYKGHLRHSSNWDPSFVPDGKKIAVIGNGASGLQVVPQLQKVASHLDHYARSKTWIAGSFGGEELIRGPGRELPPQEPEAYLAHRKELEEGSWSRFSTIIKDSERNKASKETFIQLMKKRLAGREDLLESITPDFSPNCRRLTPGPGYLEAIQEDNVDLIRTPIERFTKTGIRTIDGQEHDYDAIICSTGADIQFTPPFPVIAGDIDLNRDWRPDGKIGFPDTYLGIGAPNFPNFIIVLGPNSTGLGGTVPHAIETELTYIAKILRKVSSQGIRTITPTQEATNDFRAYCESFFPRTVMSEHCSSWYNGGIPGGRIHGLWPGSGTHVTQARRDVRWEDFKYTYKNPQGNRFAYFGNGFSTKDEAATVADKLDLSINFTPYLKAESVRGEVDLKALHESWYEI